MNILDRLDEARRSMNVLEHPFYRRWNAGELTAEELADYAGEYRRAVLALAAAAELAADQAPPQRREGLLAHAAEEAAHVELWDAFVGAACGSPAQDGEPALAQTQACERAWTAGESLLEHLAVLYVIESGQPEISRTKIDGLTAHYGYTEEGPATEYFRVHEVLDVEHARQAGQLIDELMAQSTEPEEQAHRMLDRARSALRANWLLLDGVEAARAKVL